MNNALFTTTTKLARNVEVSDIEASLIRSENGLTYSLKLKQEYAGELLEALNAFDIQCGIIKNQLVLDSFQQIAHVVAGTVQPTIEETLIVKSSAENADHIINEILLDYKLNYRDWMQSQACKMQTLIETALYCHYNYK